MKIVLTILLFISFHVAGADIKSCDVSVSKNIEKLANIKNGKITAHVFGAPCNDAMYFLKIYAGKELVYSYQEKFRPLVGILWDDTNEKDAKRYLNSELDDYLFSDCKGLPDVDEGGMSSYYGELLISPAEYNGYKGSKCKFYTHIFRDNDGSRIVVFPTTGQKAVAVR